MDNSEQKKVTIYSYSKVWKVEKRIYAIQNLVLPVPIDPWQLLYFGITWAAINLTFGALPGFSSIPVVIRSILIPYLISKFLLTKKLDGKNPIRYMIGIVMFLFCEQDKALEHFKLQPVKKRQAIKLSWNCSQGDRR